MSTDPLPFGKRYVRLILRLPTICPPLGPMTAVDIEKVVAAPAGSMFVQAARDDSLLAYALGLILRV